MAMIRVTKKLRKALLVIPLTLLFTVMFAAVALACSGTYTDIDYDVDDTDFEGYHWHDYVVDNKPWEYYKWRDHIHYHSPYQEQVWPGGTHDYHYNNQTRTGPTYVVFRHFAATRSPLYQGRKREQRHRRMEYEHWRETGDKYEETWEREWERDRDCVEYEYEDGDRDCVDYEYEWECDDDLIDSDWIGNFSRIDHDYTGDDEYYWAWQDQPKYALLDDAKDDIWYHRHFSPYYEPLAMEYRYEWRITNWLDLPDTEHRHNDTGWFLDTTRGSPPGYARDDEYQRREWDVFLHDHYQEDHEKWQYEHYYRASCPSWHRVFGDAFYDGRVHIHDQNCGYTSNINYTFQSSYTDRHYTERFLEHGINHRTVEGPYDWRTSPWEPWKDVDRDGQVDRTEVENDQGWQGPWGMNAGQRHWKRIWDIVKYDDYEDWDEKWRYKLYTKTNYRKNIDRIDSRYFNRSDELSRETVNTEYQYGKFGFNLFREPTGTNENITANRRVRPDTVLRFDFSSIAEWRPKASPYPEGDWTEASVDTMHLTFTLPNCTDAECTFSSDLTMTGSGSGSQVPWAAYYHVPKGVSPGKVTGSLRIEGQDVTGHDDALVVEWTSVNPLFIIDPMAPEGSGSDNSKEDAWGDSDLTR